MTLFLTMKSFSCAKEGLQKNIGNTPKEFCTFRCWKSMLLNVGCLSFKLGSYTCMSVGLQMMLQMYFGSYFQLTFPPPAFSTYIVAQCRMFVIGKQHTDLVLMSLL